MDTRNEICEHITGRPCTPAALMLQMHQTLNSGTWVVKHN